MSLGNNFNFVYNNNTFYKKFTEENNKLLEEHNKSLDVNKDGKIDSNDLKEISQEELQKREKALLDGIEMLATNAKTLLKPKLQAKKRTAKA